MEEDKADKGVERETAEKENQWWRPIFDFQVSGEATGVETNKVMARSIEEGNLGWIGSWAWTE